MRCDDYHSNRSKRGCLGYLLPRPTAEFEVLLSILLGLIVLELMTVEETTLRCGHILGIKQCFKVIDRVKVEQYGIAVEIVVSTQAF